MTDTSGLQPVTVVTDSTSCLPDELLERYSIRVIPLHLLLNGRDLRDRIDISPKEVYQLLAEGGKPPTTSAINPGEFAQVFSELAAASRAVLYVSVSQALSATYECAQRAAEMVRSDNPGAQVEVVDSRTSCGAMGFVALEAARRAAGGGTLKEVVQEAEALVPRVKYMCIRETLRYLMRMGRASATATESLDVRQITGLDMETGRVQLLRKLNQDEDRVKALGEMVVEMVSERQMVHAIVHFSNNRDEGERLKRLISRHLKCAELYMSEYSPLVTCASGPLLGVGFYS
ncbi:MAG: DegV family protein [Chloroflexota bacterium]